MTTSGEADGFRVPEGNIANPLWVGIATSSGSKSTACQESTRVNVGDPANSQRDRVWINKPKSRGYPEN